LAQDNPPRSKQAFAMQPAMVETPRAHRCSVSTKLLLAGCLLLSAGFFIQLDTTGMLATNLLSRASKTLAPATRTSDPKMSWYESMGVGGGRMEGGLGGRGYGGSIRGTAGTSRYSGSSSEPWYASSGEHRHRGGMMDGGMMEPDLFRYGTMNSRYGRSQDPYGPYGQGSGDMHGEESGRYGRYGGGMRGGGMGGGMPGGGMPGGGMPGGSMPGGSMYGGSPLGGGMYGGGMYGGSQYGGGQYGFNQYGGGQHDYDDYDA